MTERITHCPKCLEPLRIVAYRDLQGGFKVSVYSMTDNSEAYKESLKSLQEKKDD